MNMRTCSHESDVLDLVAIDQWPQRADASLRAHVAGCELCTEVASIAVVVRKWSDGDAIPRMLDASVVWHRAQVKARADAARIASKPVWVAQACGAVALVVALIWIGPSAGWYAGLWSTMTQAMPSASLGMPDVTAPQSGNTDGLMSGWGTTVFLALAGLAAVVSLALGALRFSERREI